MAHAVRDIRRRIKAIRSTQQITRAMQMVAAARLRKAQGRAVSARAYATKLAELLGRLTADGAHAGHALLQVRPVRKATLVLVGSDRGLAGSFNTNLFRRMEALVAGYRRKSVDVEFVVLGRKGRDYLKRRGVPIAREEMNVPDDDLPNLARDLAVRLVDHFTRGQTDEVVIVYSKFVSTLVQRPTELRLLPVAGPEPAAGAGHSEAADGTAWAGDAPAAAEADEAADPGAEGSGGDGGSRRRGSADEERGDYRYVYEPSARAVYSLLLPKFVSNQLFQTFLESRASGYAAQMTAMAAATDNAEELVGKLTLEMHHARQGSITQEIMELVGGAEALKEK